VQEGLGGKARAIVLGVVVGLTALGSALYFVPYPLKMEATGNLLPEERAYIHPIDTGYVDVLGIKTNDDVMPVQKMVRVFNPDLQKQLNGMDQAIKSAENMRDAARNVLSQDQSHHELKPADRADWQLKEKEADSTIAATKDLFDKTIARYGAQGEEHGYYWLKAPAFPPTRESGDAPVWTVLTPDFRDTLRTKPIDPKEPVLRLGNKRGKWEVETKIPQKHIGQVLHAFEYLSEREGHPVDELDVDLVVRSDPTHTYHGKLARHKIANQADPHRDDNNETEPVVLAWVRIDGPDIDKPVPKDLLSVAGTEVKVKIHCGPHRMGYSLFYGVWEFFYEKILFFF